MEDAGNAAKHPAVHRKAPVLPTQRVSSPKRQSPCKESSALPMTSWQEAFLARTGCLVCRKNMAVIQDFVKRVKRIFFLALLFMNL